LNNQQSGRGVTAGTATAQGGAQGLLFNRFSYVGISGRYGEIHLGREYTGAFISTVIADPFLVTGPANALNMLANLALSNPAAAQSTFASTSNMINYLTPTVAGLTGNMQVFFGENASNTNNDGDGYAASVTYAKGPLLLTYGKQSTNGTATAAVAGKTLATQGDYKQSGLSATYDLGVAKLAFTNAHEELLRATGLAVNNSNLIGVTVPYGLAKFKASYTLSRQNSGVIGDTDKSASMVGLGVEYSIFKDATAYATYARISNADGGNSYNNGIANSDLNNSSQGYAIGLVYKF
jgi:predicted porin